jgi:hypothetical protein
MASPDPTDLRIRRRLPHHPPLPRDRTRLPPARCARAVPHPRRVPPPPQPTAASCRSDPRAGPAQRHRTHPPRPAPARPDHRHHPHPRERRALGRARAALRPQPHRPLAHRPARTAHPPHRRPRHPDAANRTHRPRHPHPGDRGGARRRRRRPPRHHHPAPRTPPSRRRPRPDPRPARPTEGLETPPWRTRHRTRSAPPHLRAACGTRRRRPPTTPAPDRARRHPARTAPRSGPRPRMALVCV